MADGTEQLDRLQTALFAAGDVVYDWDLIDDAITWVGRTDALFGGSIAVATGCLPGADADWARSRSSASRSSLAISPIEWPALVARLSRISRSTSSAE